MRMKSKYDKAQTIDQEYIGRLWFDETCPAGVDVDWILDRQGKRNQSNDGAEALNRARDIRKPVVLSSIKISRPPLYHRICVSIELTSGMPTSTAE